MLSAFVLEAAAWVMIGLGLLTAYLLTRGKMTAAYGRYSHQTLFTEMTIPCRVAWFTQELPCVLVPVWLLLSAELPLFWQPANLLVCAMFIGHYVHRTFIFSLRIVGGKPTPLSTWLLAVLFCVCNGYMQVGYHAAHADLPPSSTTTVIGVLLFAVGMTINVQSDHILRSLRRPGETGYKIPRGGMFEFVSGANFFGEIVEWFGYALAANTVVAYSFAIFTACNIGPRALKHHQWYLDKFEDYPKQRRAIIPFLL